MGRLATLAALLLLLVAAGSTAAATIAVEHSLDGGKTYVPAGAITLSTTRKGATAVLDRSALSAEQQAALATLVAADGALYRLRLPASGVAAAFPARCLAAAATPGGLQLDVLEGGHVAAISVAAPCRRATSAPPASAPALPASQELGVRLPAAAPDVLPLLAAAAPGAAGAAGLGVPLEAGADAGAQAAGAGQQQQQQQQGGTAGAADGKGAAGKKPEEEKTWLQKNWMLVAPLGFILLNILGNGMGAQQQQQQQQRPGGGGAPVRVAARR
ncbi:hypothetical protein ABPG75_005425 [Micractinium tetrahymenae]